jgi:hypothetical protein
VPETFPFTSEQRKEFDRRGIVRLPGFYPRDAIDLMAARLWADLERRFGVIRDRPETWTVVGPAQFQALNRSGAFSALGSAKMFDLADALLGAGAWDEPAPWGGPLVTFPSPAPRLQRPAWHLDIGGVESLNPLPVLRVFTFLEPMQPNGGGTLYVAGSHRLALEIERVHDGPVRSAYVRERLKSEYPWFASLLAARGVHVRELINVESQVGDYSVRLEEMTGAPGDLIIMHPAILHGGWHNALDRPRMMLTAWIYRRDSLME